MASSQDLLLINRKVGESLIVGDLQIVVVSIGKDQTKVRIGIQACDPNAAASSHSIQPVRITSK